MPIKQNLQLNYALPKAWVQHRDKPLLKAIGIANSMQAPFQCCKGSPNLGNRNLFRLCKRQAEQDTKEKTNP